MWRRHGPKFRQIHTEEFFYFTQVAKMVESKFTHHSFPLYLQLRVKNMNQTHVIVMQITSMQQNKSWSYCTNKGIIIQLDITQAVCIYQANYAHCIIELKSSLHYRANVLELTSPSQARTIYKCLY